MSDHAVETDTSGCAASWSFIWALVWLGFLWRLLISSMTPVPSEDGANYLWMAEQFAAGQPAQALNEVFPPLLPMLLAPWIWLGADPFRCGQVMLAVVGALTVVPIVRASEAMLSGSGRCAGCMVVVATLPVKYSAEIYTEPLFILIGGFAFWAGAVRRWWLMGLLSAVAFWVRPEAVLIPAAFLLFRPGSWRSFIPLTIGVLGLMVWRGLLGNGWALIGKLPLIWERSVFQADGVGAGVSRFFSHAGQVPLLYLEAFTVMGLLAIWGGLRRREPCVRPVLWAWLMVLLVVSAFLPRRRFLVGWMFTVAPLAAMGFSTLPRKWHDLLLALIVVSGLMLSLRVTEPNREAERQVGHFLKRQMSETDLLTSDMTRVRYFAGRRPNPPEHLTVEHLVSNGRRSRFVVLGSRRKKTPEVVAQLKDYSPVDLPAEIRKMAAERGILVLGRR